MRTASVFVVDLVAAPLLAVMRRSNRRLLATVAVSAAGVASVGLAAPVAAAPPVQVTIVSEMFFVPDDFSVGTFDAAGSAVENGLICESGTVVDTHVVFGGFQSGRGAQILVRKTFTCDDGSGTFFVKIQVHLDFATATESFSWVIQGGTEAYEQLRGSGHGTTVGVGSDPQTGVINTYDGFVLD
jgi:hypothetical protein